MQPSPEAWIGYKNRSSTYSVKKIRNKLNFFTDNNIIEKKIRR